MAGHSSLDALPGNVDLSEVSKFSKPKTVCKSVRGLLDVRAQRLRYLRALDLAYNCQKRLSLTYRGLGIGKRHGAGKATRRLSPGS